MPCLCRRMIGAAFKRRFTSSPFPVCATQSVKVWASRFAKPLPIRAGELVDRVHQASPEGRQKDRPQSSNRGCNVFSTSSPRTRFRTLRPTKSSLEIWPALILAASTFNIDWYIRSMTASVPSRYFECGLTTIESNARLNCAVFRVRGDGCETSTMEDPRSVVYKSFEPPTGRDYSGFFFASDSSRFGLNSVSGFHSGNLSPFAI